MERMHWSSLVEAMSLVSEVSLRGGMSWIPQAMACHNQHDTLGLAENSSAHRRSWEERGLKRGLILYQADMNRGCADNGLSWTDFAQPFFLFFFLFFS